MSAEPVPERLWPRISDLIARSIGLHFPPERRADLQRGFAGAAMELGFESAASCAEWLVNTQPTSVQLHTLASHLTIGETYFFRERKTFDALESHVLPTLMRRRAAERRLRVWSAACATGEEPYSLAILLRQLLPRWEQWNVTILATDINERFLQKAVTGVYGEWSFRDTTPEFRQQYFKRTAEGRYEILPEIRDSVTFAPLNLVQDGFPSLATDTNAMDLILCRNVLIYFTPAHTRTLVGKLWQALAPEGWLAVSPSECSQTMFSRFATENFPGAILYRRGERIDAPATLPDTTPSAELGLPFAGEEVPSPSALDSLSPAPTAVVATANTPTLAVITRALANEGNLAEARLAAERWITAEKLEPAAHYLHAMILQELGDRTTARRSLQRAIYLNPDFALAHFALGNVARDEGRTVEAGKHFRNALDLLRTLPPNAGIPESDGLSAGRLTEIIGTLLALPRSAA